MTANVEPWSPNGEIKQLSGTRFTDIRWVVETGSTNADLMQMAADGRREPVVLFTDHQTAGRGRQNRGWHDLPGDSLLVSVLCGAEPEWASLVPLATGLAAVLAIDRYLTCDSGRSPVGLKWPNDVLVDDGTDRKLAGILVEGRTGSVERASDHRQMSLVIGMGLNLRWSTPPPVEVRSRGTTLELVANAGGSRPAADRVRSEDHVRSTLPPSTRDDLLIQYLIALDETLGELAGHGGSDLTVNRYRGCCLTLGRDVVFTTSNGTVAGRARAVSAEGHLVVVDQQGRDHTLVSGDAHHQRTGPAEAGD